MDRAATVLYVHRAWPDQTFLSRRIRLTNRHPGEERRGQASAGEAARPAEEGTAMRVISLGVVLLVFWLLLSGHYTVFLISLGVASTLGVTALAVRMGVADAEGHPVHLVPAAFTYWPWLATQIFTSALRVARIIVDPAMPISPTLVRVHGSQRGALGITTYANSITLTPGTVSVELDRHDILVHALERVGADEIEQRVMDEHVTAFEGGR